MVPMKMKNLSVENYRNKNRRCEPDGYNCKLCKDVSKLGYVYLDWLWDIGLTVRIHKFCLILIARKYLYWHLSARSQHGGDCSRVKNEYRVNDDDNWLTNVNDIALVSVMLPSGLFHGLFLCFFCLFWVGNYRLFRHTPFAFNLFLTSVNSLFALI